MSYLAKASVGLDNKLIMKNEKISEAEYKKLSDDLKRRFVLVKDVIKEPPGKNEIIGDTPEDKEARNKIDKEETTKRKK